MRTFVNKLRWFASLSLMGGILLLSACDDDDDKKSSAVLLESFGPAGVLHGEDLVFIGENLDKVSSVVFAPDVEIPSSQFKEASGRSFKVVVPASAEAGRVKLNHAGGIIESKTVIDFNVTAVITSVTPEAKPGTNITITGTMLNWVESITFAADLVVEKADFVSVSQTELVVEVPMEAQTGYLIFEVSGTEGESFSSEEQLIVTLPEVTSVSPASLKHTDVLTLTGTALDLVTKLTFPGGAEVESADFVSQSESSIEVAVPATSVDGTVVLTVASGLTVDAPTEISIILPDVAAFAPADTDLHVEGTQLTMTGTNLDLVKSITFPGVTAAVTSFVSQSATSIVVVIPAGVQGGSVQLTTIHGYGVPVAVPFGDQLTLAVAFYDDGAKNGFGQWGGWGSTTEWNSIEQIRLGTHAIKVTYDGEWSGGAQMGGGNVSTAGTAIFAFSVYGGAGTDGKNLQLLAKSSGGEATKQVTIAEGEWTDFQIPLSELGNPTNVTEFFFQNANFSGTIYIDHIGLK